MKATWLHVSDFHIRAGDPYDRNLVLRALVASVREQRERGRAPDLIFATGDVAHSGKASEYDIATTFFDALIAAAGLERRHLFVVPGNHDVDCDQAIGLARTLESREQADAYFAPDIPKPHLSQKLGAFRRWYDRYFEGIRAFPADTTCGPMEVVVIGDCRIAVLPLNTALFCLNDDADHAKLLVGRRCLDQPLEDLKKCGADLSVALLHHPLEWLSDIERANVKTGLHAFADVVLWGHLHETEVESVVPAGGGALHLAAGAAYQTRRWPNRAIYATFDGRQLRVFPIRYEDSPTEIWTVDPSVFPREPNYEKCFPIPRFAETSAAVPLVSPEPVAVPRFRSNIPSRGDLPFVGREQLLERMATDLGDPAKERVLLLHGPPGVGKSELAREFARRQRDRYPGGTFFISSGGGVELVELARIGANVLGLPFAPDLSLKDQCERTLVSFGAAPVLLIYDNPSSLEAIRPWLPRSGMPCHVLITSVNERWSTDWPTMAVKPLTPETSLELVERVAGGEVAARHGQNLVELAGGLPIQIVPASRVLAYEARRGRLDSAVLNIAPEARDSFRLVYQTLEPLVRLLLHAAAFLATQHIVRRELFRHLEAACNWKQAEFDRYLDVCLDLHLLEGAEELRMHQLFASFLLDTEVSDG